MKKLRFVFAMLMGGLVGAFVVGNPLPGALLGWGERESTSLARSIDGVQFCPSITTRSLTHAGQVRKNHPVKDITVLPDTWSDYVTVTEADLRIYRQVDWWHDQLVGLCVLYEKPSGELVATYIPSRLDRSDTWQPVRIKFKSVRFASPDGIQNVHVAFLGDDPR